MGHLRAIARILGLLLVTGACYSVLLVTAPVFRRLRGSSTRWRAGLLRRWACWAAPIAGLRVEVRGSPPRAPFFLVSNHLGYLDVVLLASHLECAFVAKAEVERWPVLGRLSRCVNTLFIERDSPRDIPRVVRGIEQAMAEGLGIVVFPEGTSSEGARVLEFRPPLLEAAARARIPVSYASLSYRVDAGAGSARREVCWWGDMGFPGHVFRLLQLPRVHGLVRFGDGSIQHEDRKILAERLWLAVTGQFRPVVDQEGS
jgi:1-acyl-sn-glycerol-3-phosphate acyltransferase